MKKKTHGPHPEHPLIFTAHSVAAILAGVKTQTRRIIQRPKIHGHAVGCDVCWNASVPHNGTDAAFGGPCYLRAPACDHVGGDGYPGGGRIWPRWNVGDHVWAKERWSLFSKKVIWDNKIPGVFNVLEFGHYELYRGKATADFADRVLYAADYEAKLQEKVRRLIKNRSPMFMPRWASRITLEVKSVRVERLHEISEEDARAEGVEPTLGFLVGNTPHRRGFYEAWEKLHGKRAPWESNPFVWRIEFAKLCQLDAVQLVPTPIPEGT